MAIQGLDKDQFVSILYAHISPSRVIDSFERLHGREDQLRRVEQALYSPGRQVFIYGDRGVGKSSLAKTTAYVHQSADNSPIYVLCESRSSFSSVITNIAREFLRNPTNEKTTKSFKTEFRILNALTAELGEEVQSGSIPEISDVGTAVGLIDYLASNHSKKTVIVIDEFDLLKNQDDKHQFAELIKQVGDKSIEAQFIFCGIARSLEELFEGHGSVHRYFEAIQLDRLHWTGRWEIIDACATALDIEINEDSRFRIAAISDGFPHYIHLVCDKLFWSVFDDPQVHTIATPDHYMEAIRMAVSAIEAKLKQSYEKATMRTSDEYHDILWAAADHFELVRPIDAIYRSYQRIMKLQNKEPIDRKHFTPRLQNLKTKSYGEILSSPRTGFYEFSESMVRGYVRLRAEERGVRLALEHEPGPEPTLLTAGGVRQLPLPTFPRPTFGKNRKY